MVTRKNKLVRFDLMLPAAVVKIVNREAAVRCIHPRTMGRILLAEKIKEVIGLAPDDVLPDVDDPAQVSHAATHTEGGEHDRCSI